MNLAVLNLLSLPQKDGMRRSYMGQRFSKIPGNSEERLSPTEYAYGDNLRKADWNAYAKTGILHVHRSESYSAPIVRIVHNDSPTMLYGRETSKNAVQVAAYRSLSYVGMRGGSEVMLEKESGNLRLKLSDIGNIQELTKPVVWGSTPEHDHVIAKISRNCADSLIIFSTDMRTSGETLSLLRNLSINNLLCILLVKDPSELSLRSAGVLRFQDPLTGEIVKFDSSSRSLAAKYEELALRKYLDVRNQIQGMGAFLIELNTTSVVDDVLGSRLPRRV